MKTKTILFAMWIIALGMMSFVSFKFAACIAVGAAITVTAFVFVDYTISKDPQFRGKETK